MKNHPLIERLAQCTYKVFSMSRQGTGIRVGPSQILTCAHVLGYRQDEVEVLPYGAPDEEGERISCKVIVYDESQYDLCVLELPVAEPKAKAVWLESDPAYQLPAQGKGLVFGYGLKADGGGAEWVSLISIDRQTQTDLEPATEYQLKFTSGQISPGDSGGPVLDLKTGRLVGMIRRTRGENSDLGGRAIPVSLIIQQIPDLKGWQAQLLPGLADEWTSLIRQYQDENRQAQSQETERINKLSTILANQGPKDLSNVPVNPPRYFIGREEKQAEVLAKLHAGSKVLLVNGLGGIGKTALALKFWSEQHENYNYRAWASCGEGLWKGLLSSRLVQELEVPLNLSADMAQFRALFFSRMRDVPGQNLLVLDSANQREELLSFNAQLPNWSVLITSRSRVDELEVVELGTLEPEDAIKLFRKHARRKVAHLADAAVTEFLVAIGYHTLLIELMAKNLSRLRSYTFEGFVEVLNTQGLLQIPGQPVVCNYRPGEEKQVTEIIRGVFDLTTLDEDALLLLREMALLPAEFIPYPVLQWLVGGRLDAPEDLDPVINTLWEQGWLEEELVEAADGRTGDAVKLHQLIQEIVLDAHPPEYALFESMVEALKGRLENERLKLGEKIALLPYAESVAGHFTEVEAGLAFLNGRIGEVSVEIGNLPLAEKALNQALDLFMQTGNKANTAISYGKLGDIHKAQGNFEAALNYYELDLKIVEELSDSNPHSESLKNSLAISYEKLGSIHEAQGNYEAALKYYELDLKITEELSDSNPHSEGLKNGLAISYGKLGSIHQAQGNYEAALKYYELDLKIMEELSDSNPHSEGLKHGLAISYSKLGEIHEAQGNYKAALNYYSDYNKLTAELSDSNPHNEGLKNDLAISYSKLGDIHKAQGNYESALNYYELDLKITAELSNSNPHSEGLKHGLAISYSKLGEIHEAQGNYKAALNYYELDLKITVELSDSNPHSEGLKHGLAISYGKLGEIHEAQGNYESALNYYEDVTKLFEELSDSNPYSVDLINGLAISYLNLGSIHEKLNAPAKAKAYFEQAKAIYQKLVNAVPSNVTFKHNLEWVENKLNSL